MSRLFSRRSLHLPLNRLHQWQRSIDMDRIEDFASHFGEDYIRYFDLGLLAMAGAVGGLMVLVMEVWA